MMFALFGPKHLSTDRVLANPRRTHRPRKVAKIDSRPSVERTGEARRYCDRRGGVSDRREHVPLPDRLCLTRLVVTSAAATLEDQLIRHYLVKKFLLSLR